MAEVCKACGKPVRLINYDKARGVVGLTMAWVHVNRFIRHRPWVEEKK